MKKQERGTTTYHTAARLHRMIDADTFEFDLDLGFNINHRVSVRCMKFNAPETWRPRNDAERAHGEAAKQKAAELLGNGEVELVSYYRDMKKGKYGRYTAYIYLPDGREYGAVMEELGFAKKSSYDE
jgi:endonuclease YncB( thermonuclease family)